MSVTTIANTAQNCHPVFLYPHSWCFCIIETVIAILSIILNCAIAVTVYYAIPISVLLRRALAVISLNYTFIAALHLARNLFFIFSVNYPCIHIVTTINCKLQEFPLVFAYIHCAILPCSIMMAIKDHEKAFWLLTLLIGTHAGAVGILHVTCVCKGRPRNFHQVLIYEFRDFVALETLFWEIALFFTGVLSVYRAIATDICYQCLAIIMEISFVLIPLCISFAHPFLVLWFVMSVRNAAVRLCPIVKKIMPEYEMPTPPLPEMSPYPPRRDEAHSISQILIRSPNTMRITRQ